MGTKRNYSPGNLCLNITQHCRRTVEGLEEEVVSNISDVGQDDIDETEDILNNSEGIGYFFDREKGAGAISEDKQTLTTNSDEDAAISDETKV